MDATQVDIDTAVWWPDQTIPALAVYGLDRVPGWRPKAGVTIPTGWRPTPGEEGYEDPAWRSEHKAWARELRDVVRPWITRKALADPRIAAMERQLCAADPNYFGAVYGWIQDPQPLADEEQDKPFAKFAYQCVNTAVMQDWAFRDRREKAVLWRTKSRQLGISWDDEHFDTWFYLFQRGKAKLASRSERWVHNGLSTEAMFGKIKYIVMKLAEHAPFLLPEGYSVHKLLMAPLWQDLTLTNPVTGTQLMGESTTAKVGRGGTYTFARVDEDAFIRELMHLIVSLQPAAPRIFCASTESFELGFDHFEGWQAAKRDRPETVLEFNWHQNAYLDTAWERQVLAAALTPKQREGVMREVFRNPFAGFGEWVYPEARTLPDANQPYNPEEPLDLTIDPAGSGDDLAVMATQATAIDGQEGFHVLWSYERKLPNPERIAHLLTGIWPERGDICFGWEPDAEEREIGRFLYDAWVAGRELRFFMDPAADQVHSTRTSFWSMLRDLSRDLRQREVERLTVEQIAREEAGKPPLALPTPKPIAARFKAVKQHRLMGDREFALRRVLPHVTFQTGVPSAGRVRECLSKTSYNELAKAAVTEAKRRHDQYSHLASCCEYYAIYMRYGFVDPLDTKEMRALQRHLGLRGPGRAGVPAGFANRAIPKGFGANRPGLPPTSGRMPRDRVAPGGWR